MEYSNYVNNKYQNIKTHVSNYTPKIIMSILILLVFFTVANYYKSLIIDNGVKKSGTEIPTSEVIKILAENSNKDINSEVYKQNIIKYELAYITYYLIIFSGIIITITNIGIESSTIFAILGTFGLAIGLALQGSLTNLTSGIYIGLSNIFNIGDKIKINNATGIIQKFSLFNTTINDENGHNIIIPNSIIQSNILTNYSS